MVKLLCCLIALFLLAGAALVRAEGMGRLFFTPEERAFLDRARMGTELSAPEASAAPNSVTLNGHIKRTGGKSTVWLNGVPLREGDAPKQIKITDKTPEEIAVRLPDSNHSYPLKVGQTLTPSSGEIREGYHRSQRTTAAPDTSSNATPDGLNAAKK